MKDSYYDVLYRAEARHWWYRVRREMVHFLLPKYAAERPLKILDMGCGTGALLVELSRYGDAYGMDFSPKAVTFCKERGLKNVTVGKGESLPYKSDEFDAALSLDVLEHIEEDELAMRELCRVLKPGGVLIAFVPAFMFLWGPTDVVSRHFRRYTKREMLEKLKRAGFKIERASYFNFFLFAPILLVRFIERLLPAGLRPEHETDMGSGIFNEILYKIFRLESKLFRPINLPFGVSLAVIARKP